MRSFQSVEPSSILLSRRTDAYKQYLQLPGLALSTKKKCEEKAGKITCAFVGAVNKTFSSLWLSGGEIEQFTVMVAQSN